MGGLRMTRQDLSLSFALPKGEWWVAFSEDKKQVERGPTLVFPDEVSPYGQLSRATFAGAGRQTRSFSTREEAETWIRTVCRQWRVEGSRH